MTPREVLALCREKEVKAVDLRFCDLLGTWQHFTIPVGRLDEGVFEDGLGFDGSSIRGWQGIHESDMLVLPQAETALVDPLAAVPTLAMIASVQDPVTGEPKRRTSATSCDTKKAIFPARRATACKICAAK